MRTISLVQYSCYLKNLKNLGYEEDPVYFFSSLNLMHELVQTSVLRGFVLFSLLIFR